VAQSFLVAARWFQTAADQGDAQAQFDVDFAFYTGLGVKKTWQSSCIAKYEKRPLTMI
jgi:TPR repeat protein